MSVKSTQGLLAPTRAPWVHMKPLMAARTGKRSILTILRKNRGLGTDCYDMLISIFIKKDVERRIKTRISRSQGSISNFIVYFLAHSGC